MEKTLTVVVSDSHIYIYEENSTGTKDSKVDGIIRLIQDNLTPEEHFELLEILSTIIPMPKGRKEE